MGNLDAVGFPEGSGEGGNPNGLKGKTHQHDPRREAHRCLCALAKQLGKEFPSSSIQILVDPRVNMVFVTANATDTGRIVKRMKQLDKPSAQVKKAGSAGPNDARAGDDHPKGRFAVCLRLEVAEALNKLFTDIKANVVVEPGRIRWSSGELPIVFPN